MKELVITSSVMIAAVVLLRWLFRGKVSQKLIYAAWLLVAARLLIPIQFGSFDFSLQSQTAPVTQIIDKVSKEPVSGPSREELYDEIIHDYIDQGEPIFIPEIQQQIDSELVSSPEKDPEEIYDHYLQSNQQVILPEVQNKIEQSVDNSVNPLTIGQIAAIVWATGMAGMAVWFTAVNISFGRRLRRSAVQLDYPQCPVRVLVSPLIASPCLFGLIRPSIYLTPQCEGNETQSRHVLIHELTHLKHRDHIWSLVRCVCLCVYWFNPLVWLAAYLSKRDCELACDEAALKTLGDEERIAYGKTLVDMVAASPSPVQLIETATAMHETKKQLKERVNRIVKNHKHFLTAAICLILIVALVTGCAFGGPKASDPVTDPTVTEPTDTIPPTTSAPDNTYLTGNIQIPETSETNSELDASDIEALFSKEGSWLNMALTSLYDSHEKMDLKSFFSYGIPGESNALTADEREFLVRYYGYNWNEPVIRLPIEKMIEILDEHYPVSIAKEGNYDRLYRSLSYDFDLSDIACNDYTGCCYFRPTGTKSVTNFRVLDIEHTAKNSYLVFYEADVPFSHENKTFLLKFSYIDGTCRIISNTQTDLQPGVIPDIPDPGKFAQLPEDPKIEDLVYTNYALDLQWDSSSYGTPYSNEYSFRLPAITPFSADAVAVNENIHSTFMSFVYGMRSRYYSQPYQSGLSYRIDYEAYLSDNILSIVISSARRQNNAKEYETPIYYIYNLDLATGERMTYAELVHKYLGESYAQFLAHCSNDLPRYFSDNRSTFPAYAYTNSDETAIQLYVENGKLILLGHIISGNQLIRTPFEEIDQYGWQKTNEAVYHSYLSRFPEMNDPSSSYSSYLRSIFYAEPELFVSMLAQEEEEIIRVNSLRLVPEKPNSLYSTILDSFPYYLYYLIDNSKDLAVVNIAKEMLSIAVESLLPEIVVDNTLRYEPNRETAPWQSIYIEYDRWLSKKGTVCSMDIRLPFLTPFSKDAIAINESILETIQPIFDTLRRNYVDGVASIDVKIDYSHSTHDDILTLIIEWSSGNQIECYYCYKLDLLSGELLSITQHDASDPPVLH